MQTEISPPPLASVRERILSESDKLGLSLRQLAIKADIPHSVMYRFRDGHSVSTDTLESLMHAVGIVARPVAVVTRRTSAD